MMDGWMTAGMGLWGLVLIVMVIAAVAGAVLGGIWLVHGRGGPSEPIAPVEDAAAQQLRRRYAAGEIDDEEFERRLSALTLWR